MMFRVLRGVLKVNLLWRGLLGKTRANPGFFENMASENKIKREHQAHPSPRSTLTFTYPP